MLLKGRAARRSTPSQRARLCDLDLLVPAGRLDAAHGPFEVGYTGIGGCKQHEAHRRYHFRPAQYTNGFVVSCIGRSRVRRRDPARCAFSPRLCADGLALALGVLQPRTWSCTWPARTEDTFSRLAGSSTSIAW
jgi:hypothetical protein